MDRSKPTFEEIRRRGIEALTRELGPVGMARFLQQFEAGQGDYTRDRQHRPTNADVHSLAAQIRERRHHALPEE